MDCRARIGTIYWNMFVNCARTPPLGFQLDFIRTLLTRELNEPNFDKYVNYPSYEAKNKDATGKLLSTVISIKVVNKYDMLSTLTLARNHLGQEYVLKKIIYIMIYPKITR